MGPAAQHPSAIRMRHRSGGAAPAVFTLEPESDPERLGQCQAVPQTGGIDNLEARSR
jgi:hypothetical protein